MIILGIDPGLAKTGWGIINSVGNSLSYVACGTIKTDSKAPMHQRLATIHAGLKLVLSQYNPETVAVEETYVNSNPRTSLKLGQARGICLLVPSLKGLQVAEYTPAMVKKSIVGSGRADKNQIGYMVKTLLPTAKPDGEDSADALAIAITHAHLNKYAKLAK